MGKRKNVTQLHPQQSFQNMVADATLSKLSGYIDQEVQRFGASLSQRTATTLDALFTRIISLEELLMKTNPAITKDVLAEQVATIEDRNEGLKSVDNDAVVELGDRVRIEIKTKTDDQTEFQGQSRLMIDNAGSGNTLGQELESVLVGMKAGETRENKFGKDQKMVASITINKISRAERQEALAEKVSEQVASGEAETDSQGA